MTKQETFDIVVKALRKQGRRSIDISGKFCVYRGPEGRKCAVGHLIPDELYYPELECQSADSPQLIRILSKLGHDMEFCYELQQIHDHYTPERWEEEWTLLAEHNCLVVPPREGV